MNNILLSSFIFILIQANFFYIQSIIKFPNEILSYIEYNSLGNIDASQEKKTFSHYKSSNNSEYNITMEISSFKLKIKIDEINFSSIFYQNEYSFADLFFLNNYFRIFNSINEIYEDLIGYLENIEIIKNMENVDLIIPIQNSFINNVTFSNIKKFSNNNREKIKELYDLVDELKIQNEIYNIKINECLNENIKLKKEINDFKKGNVLLISESTNSILNYILHTTPYYNQISVLPPDYIIERLKEDIMNNFKIIIYDLKDYGFQLADDTDEMRKYLNNGGSVVVTHDQWFNRNYKGKSYELFNTSISSTRGKVVNMAKILKYEHPIFSSFYDLNEYDLKISNTHAGYNKYLDKEYLKDMVIELDDGVESEYLLIKKFGKGNLIYWNVGHESTITDYEEKLFINLISWIYNKDK